MKRVSRICLLAIFFLSVEAPSPWGPLPAQDRATSSAWDAQEPGAEAPADSLERRAIAANSLGQYVQALALFDQALSLKSSRWGPDDPECLASQLGIASIRRVYFGEFARAERLYRRHLEVAERSFGPAHPLTTEAAMGLAGCLGDLGDYASAERILRRHLDATTETHGERAGQTARLMYELAETLSMLGKDVEATALYRQAASIAEDVFGPDHTETARALAGLAHTHRRIGESAEAASLYTECIRIVEQNHGAPHPDLVQYRCQLGMCLQEGNRMSREAIGSIEKGISEATALYGGQSYVVALEERHLGLALMTQLRYEEAYPVFERCLKTLAEYFPPRHPYLSKALKGLAWTCFRLGRIEEALVAIDEAVSIQENADGADRYELAYLLNQRVGIELVAGHWDDALATAMRAAETGLGVLNENLRTGSDREAVLLTVRPWSSTIMLIMAAAAHPSPSRETWDDVFSMVATTYGRVLDWLVERRRFLDAAPESPTGELDGGAAPSDFSSRTEIISTQRIASELGPRTTLVQYIRYVSPTAQPTASDPWSEVRYGAFRLQAVERGNHELRFIDLGRADPIDVLIGDYRRAIDDARSGRRPSARLEAVYRSTARGLFDALWAPLFPSSDGDPVETGARDDTGDIVLIVPDAGLNALDFNTLLDPSLDPVIAHWRTQLLSSARSVLRAPGRRPRGEGMLAVGDPLASAKPDRDATGATDTASGIPFLCGAVEQGPRALPGARDEALDLAALFSETMGRSAEVLVGADATEHAVKQMAPGNRIIHFATHGWACDWNAGSYGQIQESPYDPLLMSGLVLASSSGDEDDGFLTGAEVTCLDLDGVDWVVLSACGSGLGRVIWGEGVFGLRRAFEIAGARTVVMALWRIDDAVARDLMGRIYRHRLSGESTVDAIRLSQLERLGESRRRFNRLHPVLWAGIVAQGDWR